MTYRYAWAVNDVDAGLPVDTVEASRTSPGDVWTCTVTPTDGVLEGAGATASVTIAVGNRPPSAPTIRISPASPTDSDVLTCVIDTESTDPDGDAVSYTYAWTVDGEDAGLNTATVGAALTVVGQEWGCNVTASDGQATSAAATASVTIREACGDGSITSTVSGIDFVTACAQTFDMGCASDDPYCGSLRGSSPQMPVTLSNNYDVSRTEITQDQYRAVMAVNPSLCTACGGDCPVESVTWDMAAAYTNKLSESEGLGTCYTCSGSGTSTSCDVAVNPYECEGYRLPTEAEWEGAARCGEDTAYAGSDTVGDVAWYMSAGGATTHTVATKSANACGLYDMSGNVWEYTQDWYNTSYYSTEPRTDPTGGDSTGYGHTLRGGSWVDYEISESVYHRWYANSDFELYGGLYGFRVVRTVR